MSDEKVIEDLTPEQQAHLDEMYKRWLDIGYSTKPLDREKVEAILTQFYEKIGQPKPQFEFLPSPKACIERWEQITGNIGEGHTQISNKFDGAWWCSREVFYDMGRYLGVEYSKEDDALLNMWLEQAEHCHIWFPYEGLCLVSERPNHLHVDDQGNLHSLEGPALGYSDGYGLYQVHGVDVPADIINDRSTITTERIRTETNQEVKRIMLELFGMKRYLDESGARFVQSDKYGELYRIEGFQLPLVKVKNGTPNPDGTYDYYVLTAMRADCKTAHDAVASTHGMTEDTYEEYDRT